jgi:hypothetical protein
MGKETKEMLKAINANLELIMKHLNIAKPVSVSQKKEKKPAVKRPAVKKTIGQKKPG